MEARKQRNIKNGLQYDHLFPKANVDNQTVLKNAGVGDTVSFIPKVVSKTLNHTKSIAKVLKGTNDYETCRNIWQFVYDHIAYRKDKEGYEQIRSPARSWHDRKAGVDCDCYTTFISSILTNLGIKHKLRITKYSRDYFQHIYPIALLPNKQVVLDCVTDKFDFEVPFSEKKDYDMDLQYLDGLDNIGYRDNYLLDGSDEMAELGKLFKKKKAAGSGGGKKKKGGGIFKKIGKGLKKVNLKKVLNVVNKFNPATVALRNGVLASMKINIGNVAKRLRWSYITPEQARVKKLDMGRWEKLVKARQKLEKIFYGAGGKPENLKKAILNGKGNKDKAVHGLEGFGRLYDYGMHHNNPNHPLNRINKQTPLRQLLGDDIFFSENSVGTLGELGEPVSMAMIAAASGVIAAIAGTIKKIGDIFGGKGEGAKDFDEEANKEAEKEIPADGKEPAEKSTDDAPSGGGSSSSGGGDDNSGGGGSGGGSKSSKESGNSGGGSSGGGGGGSESPSSGGEEEGTNGGGSPTKALLKQSGSESEDGDATPKDGFWDKNKKWIVPAGIGVAGISLIAFAAHAMKPPHPAPAPRSPSKPKALHGTPNTNHKRKKATGRNGKLKSKALL